MQKKNDLDLNFLACKSDKSRVDDELNQYKRDLDLLNKTLEELSKKYNKTDSQLRLIESSVRPLGISCNNKYCSMDKTRSQLFKIQDIINPTTKTSISKTVILKNQVEDENINIDDYEDNEQLRRSKTLLQAAKKEISKIEENKAELDQLETKRQREIESFSRLLVAFDDEPMVMDKLTDSISSLYNKTMSRYKLISNRNRDKIQDNRSIHLRYRGKRSASIESSIEPDHDAADQGMRDSICIKLDKISGRLMYKESCDVKDYESTQKLRKRENRMSSINGKSFLNNIMALSIMIQQNNYLKPDYKNYKYTCGNCTKLMNVINFNSSTEFEIVTNHVERDGNVFGDNCQNLIHKDDYCNNIKVPADSGSESSCSTIDIPSDSYSIFQKSLGKFPKRFCKFAGIKLRDCSRTHLLWKTVSVATIEKEFIFIDHMLIHQVIFRRSESSYKSDPENCRADCYSGSIKCAGDSIFCEEYGCDASSSCKIWYDKFKTGIYLINKEQGFYVQCLHTIRVLVEIELLDSFTYNNTLEGHNVKASCEKHGFKIELLRLDLFLEKIHYCISGKCFTYLSNNKYESIDIPKIYLVHDREINIIVYAVNFKIGYELNLKCPKQNLCELMKCTLCFERLLNPQCYRLIEYISWVCIIIFVSIIINIIIVILKSSIFMCTIVSFFIRILKEIIKYSYLILKVITLKSFNFIKAKLYKTRNYLEDAERSNSRIEEQLLNNTNNIVRNNNPQLDNRARRSIFSRTAILGFTLVLIMNKSVECCNNMNQIAVNTRSCEYDTNGQLKTCMIDSEVEIRLNGLGVSSCIKLDSKSGSKIGMLKAKITNLITKLHYLPVYHFETCT